MLVLSRKIGERIVIGDNIVITVVAQRGKGVRLGIEAPPEVSVHREEIHRRIQHQQVPAPPPCYSLSTFVLAES